MTGQLTYTLAFRPPGEYLTANGRYHWSKRAALTKAWRDAAQVHARLVRVPSLPRAHVVVTFGFNDRRRRDIHNLAPTAKCIVDGLVDANVLPDDDDRHLIGPDTRRAWTSVRAESVLVQIIPLDPWDPHNDS